VIVGITGHQRIPADAVGFITARIVATLEDIGHPLTGVSSLAVGADQIFAQAVLSAGGRLHVVVPCADYEKAFADDAGRREYVRLLAAASGIETLAHPAPSAAAFFEAGQRVVELSQLLIAVWDGAAPTGAGGTADLVQHARERGADIVIIWPEGAAR
jgi:nucleoside-diphosphate-sugar epimerase